MRTIKFRGKSELGEWYYGSLIISENINGGYGSQIYTESGKMAYNAVFVMKETVGQFTEQYDSNGEEMYENDLVKVPWHYFGDTRVKEQICKVVFEDGGFHLESKTDRVEITHEGVEVIGNIHEEARNE